jgi:hypothetical protein
MKKEKLAEIIYESGLLEIAYKLRIYRYPEIDLKEYIKTPSQEELIEATHIYDSLVYMSKLKQKLYNSAFAIKERKIAEAMFKIYTEPYLELETWLLRRLDEIAQPDYEGIEETMNSLDMEFNKEFKDYTDEINRRY